MERVEQLGDLCIAYGKIYKKEKNVLVPAYFVVRRLILPLEKYLPSNAFMSRCEADFTEIRISLVVVSWLSHIVRCAVKLDFLRRECGHSANLFTSPPPKPLSRVVYTVRPRVASICLLPLLCVHSGREGGGGGACTRR